MKVCAEPDDMRFGVKAAELVCLLVVLLCDGYKQEDQKPQPGECVAVQPPGIHFTLTSAQNITGHWTTQLQLEHGTGDADIENPETGIWEADVQQKTQICETSRKIIITATITAPPPKPGPGYDLIPGQGYYKVHTEALSWEDARRTCVQEGAHLIVINSEEEAKLAKDLCARHPKFGSAAFVGLHDLYTEGQFQSVLGQPIKSLGYASWLPNEPNGSDAEDCVELELQNIKFNDIACSTKRPYICEQQL